MSISPLFYKNGERRPHALPINIPKEPKQPSQDTKKRAEILKEIEERCAKSENINEIVNEIAQREDVKEIFSYYAKNGITDLASIFKNWYQSYMTNKQRTNPIKSER